MINIGKSSLNLPNDLEEVLSLTPYIHIIFAAVFDEEYDIPKTEEGSNGETSQSANKKSARIGFGADFDINQLNFKKMRFEDAHRLKKVKQGIVLVVSLSFLRYRLGE